MTWLLKENISVKQARFEGGQCLKQQGIDSFNIDARLLLQHALQQSFSWILCNPDFILSIHQKENYEQGVQRRLKREPIEKICGVKEFWSLPFYVSCDVLTPRPDSETLIALTLDVIIDRKRSLRILDLGTGSGCLLLTLLKELPHATGIGIDINFDSLQVAQKNIENLVKEIDFTQSLYERIHLVQGNWGKAINTQFDVVISNPPYICTTNIPMLADEVKLYEPLAALNGGASGLDCYNDIIGQLTRFLKPNGVFIVEAGYGQMPKILDVCNKHGFKLLKVKNDLQNIPRAAAIVYEHGCS